MRLAILPPPRDLGELAVDLPSAAWPEPTLRADAPRHRLDRLDDPTPAHRRRRHLFQPPGGWLRRLERSVSQYLSRHVFPRLPAIERPYGRILRRQLTVSRASVAVSGLPAAFDGARLLLITDIHGGPFVAPDLLIATFRRLHDLRPDAILLGGDLVTCALAEFERHAAAFRSLRAELGVFAVLGNHDHYIEDPPRLAERIEECGIRLLHNRSVELRRDGACVSLVGVDDLLWGRPDLPGALEGARPPIILLSHNPDLFFDAALHGVSLVLSGHTHAGQIRLRGLPVLVRQSRYRLDEGRYRAGATELIVSRGLGAVGLPLRIACPPEVVLVTLRTGPER